MSLIYRAMAEAQDGRPAVIDTASGLGVRDWEIDVEADGTVQPETGGMSVSPYSVENLPRFFVPRELGGTGKHPAWEMDTDDLGEDLTYRPDPDNPEGHWFIEPVRPMGLQEYREALAETRTLWSKVEVT